LPPVSSQNSRIDSLEKIIRTSKDTTKIRALNLLTSEHLNNDLEKVLPLIIQARELAEKISDKKGIAHSLNALGILYKNQGKYMESIDCHIKALELGIELRDLDIQSKCFNNLGNDYEQKADYSLALEYYYKGLKANEKINNKRGIQGSFNNIGIIFHKQGNDAKALEYYFKALKISEEMGDERSQGLTLSNVASAYIILNEYKKAGEVYKKALKLSEKARDSVSIASCLNNIGDLYLTLKQYVLANEYNFKALKINEARGYKRGISYNEINIGLTYAGLKKYDLAEKYLKESLQIAKEIGLREIIIMANSSLSDMYKEKGDYRQAYEYFKLSSGIKDSILNKENSSLVAEMSAKYQSEKNEKEIELLKKNESIQHLESIRQKGDMNRQRIIRNSFITGFVLVLLLSFFILRSYRQKQKANVLLEEQKKVIQQKNKDITDSINYARRIQQAILPSKELVYRTLENSFILHKPKDIVSGDFYAFAEKKGKVLIAAVDCTGHGVPGAFMSMIGNDLLNQIIIEKGITSPGKILEYLHEGVRVALKQDVELGESRDGMDIAVCAIDQNTLEIEFAGALRNLYLVRKGKQLIDETKGDRQSIGGTKEVHKGFTNHSLKLATGDTLYIFSDGYVDQFGGRYGKKFMSKQFKGLLLSIQDKTMKEQSEILENTIEKWRGPLEQVDDILVIGIRI
jgi:serine phosphatase RsbU (regulator of sigma subunit)/Tfp pilus assembly protein PilF